MVNNSAFLYLFQWSWVQTRRDQLMVRVNILSGLQQEYISVNNSSDINWFAMSTTMR